MVFKHRFDRITTSDNVQKKIVAQNFFMSLSESIIRTFVFFDIFDRPLTAFEAHKGLWSEVAKLEDVRATLNTSNSKIEAKNGFFFLSGKKKIVEDGSRRQIWNDKKIARARWAAKTLSAVPFIRLIAVCNTLSFGVASQESDVDFFIVARAGRLWTARFFSVLILSLFGLRRHGKKIANRVCLSFFLADDSLNLESVAIKSPPDIYLVYWIAQLVPLVNRNQTLEKFWQANSWVKQYLPNFHFENQLPDYHQIKTCPVLEACRKFCEYLRGGYLGDVKETFLRFVQLRKMSKNLKSRQSEGGTAVVINDKMLKFHEEDRREYYKNKWLEKTV